MLEGMIPYFKRALVFALVLCAFLGAIPSVFAQTGPAGAPIPAPSNPGPVINPDGSISRPTLPWLTPGSGGNTNNGNGTGNGTNGSNVNNPDIGTEPVSTPTEPPPPEPQVIVVEDCWTSPAGFLNCLVVSFFGNLAALAGSAFDGAIGMFVVGFGRYYVEYGIGYTVENVWGIIRDIFNLTFIFGLVYIGFQIILGVNESSAKRTIPLLILAALLVNFSLFAVKFVVDFSNFAAVQIYTLYQVGDQDTPTTVSPAVNILRPDDGGVSIALAFTNQMGVTGLLNNTAPMTEPGAGITYMFTMVIIFLVLAYVFLAGAILITIRFAVLIFYMIFSPVMFLGWVLPGFASYSKKFWHGLLGQAFFAPALLFMLYISYRVMQGFDDGRRTGGETFGGAGTDFNVNSFAIFIPYLIINVVFIFGSLVVARKMGAVGADSAISIGNKLQKAGRSALWAGTGGALGGAAGAYAYKKIDAAAASDNRLARGLGRTLTYAGARDKAEKAYKGSVQGQWKENRKKQDSAMATRGADAKTKKDIKAYASMAGSPDLESAVRGASTGQLIKIIRDYKVDSPEYRNIVNAMTHDQRKKLMDTKDDEFSPVEKAALGKQATAGITGRMSTNGATDPAKVAKLTPKELDVLGNKWITNGDNLRLLTNSQVEKLATDSNVLGESQKSTLKSDWEAAVNSTPAGEYASIMSNRSAKDIAALPASVLTNIAAAPYLTDKVLRAVAESNMTAVDRATIASNMNHPSANGSGEDYLTRPANNHRDTNW